MRPSITRSRAKGKLVVSLSEATQPKRPDHINTSVDTRDLSKDRNTRILSVVASVGTAGGKAFKPSGKPVLYKALQSPTNVGREKRHHEPIGGSSDAPESILYGKNEQLRYLAKAASASQGKQFAAAGSSAPRDPSAMHPEHQLERMVRNRDELGREIIRAAKRGDTAALLLKSRKLADIQARIDMVNDKLVRLR